MPDLLSVKNLKIEATSYPPGEPPKTVTLVGDFNSWSQEATPLKLGEDGLWTATLALEAGREYHFRYLIDGRTWENDWNADKYVPSPYGDADNSVVIV